MPTTDDSILINATPERVFDYITEPANFPSFQANTVRAELEGDGPVGAGSRIRGASRILGRTFDWTMEVSVHDRPTTSAFKSVEGKVGISGAYTLTPEGGGTRLNYHLDAAPGLGGVFGRIADPLVNKAYSRQVHADLETLAQILTEHDDE